MSDPGAGSRFAKSSLNKRGGSRVHHAVRDYGGSGLTPLKPGNKPGEVEILSRLHFPAWNPACASSFLRLDSSEMSFPIPNMIVVASCAAFSFGYCGTARAHGSLHDQVVEITTALEKKPGDPELLLLRAGRHRSHQDWEAASQDIAAAEKAGAGAGPLALVRAELAVARLEWEGAVRELPVLAREMPENAQAWRLAALVQTTRKQWIEAVTACRAVIKNAAAPLPEDFILLARAQYAGGADDEAITTLDAGSQHLGEISVFLEEAAQIEADRGRWDAALARLDRLIAKSPNSPRWLARKAALADRAARPELAAASRRAALAAMEALAPVRRNIPAFAELERTLRAQQSRGAGASGPVQP